MLVRLYYLSVIFFVIAFCTSVCSFGATAVGTLNGEFNVSPTGAATYEIPIECPTGPNGFKPELKFVYNSQTGDGLMGYGWTIGGLSAISRTISSIEYTLDDALTLDGLRLIKVNAANDHTEFRMEQDIYTRIVGYEPHTQGFKYFKVHTKDGRTLTYGDENGDGGNIAWPLTEICDANGNYITFQNITSYGGDIASGAGRIIYGKNKSGAGIETVIEFEYEPSPNVVTQYVGGKAIDKWARLSNVRVIVNGFMPVDEYKLIYQDKGMLSDRSRLESIIYSKSGVKVCSTNFTWTESNYVIKSIKDSNAFLIGSWINIFSLAVGDCTGDGVTNIASIGKGTELYVTNVSTGEQNRLTDTYFYDDVTFYDKDHDGVDEIIAGWTSFKNGVVRVRRYEIGKWNSNTNSYVWKLQDGETKFPASDYELYPSDKYRTEGVGGDFYGNGTLQFIPVYKKWDTGTPSIWTMMIHKLFGKEEEKEDYNYGNIGKRAMGDFPNLRNVSEDACIAYAVNVNGNAKTDLMCVYKSGYIKFYEERDGVFEEIMQNNIRLGDGDLVYPCDFNGDGSTDLLVLRDWSSKYAEVNVSTGKEFKLTGMGASLYLSKEALLSVVDINSDGKSDIVVSNPSDYRVYFSTGNSFINVCSVANELANPEAPKELRVSKLLPALCRINDGKGGGKRFLTCLNGIVEFTPDKVTDKVVKIEDGLHNTISLEYDRIGNIVPPVQESFVPEKCKDAVSRVSVLNSAGQGSVSLYSYTDVLYDKKQRRFMGYGSVSLSDENTGRKVVSNYTLKDSMVQLSGTVEMVGNVKVKSSAYSYDVKTTADAKVRASLITKHTEHDYQTGMERSVEYMNYDNNGNPCRVVAKCGKQTVTQETDYVACGPDMIAKPSYIKTTYSYGNDATTRERSMKYDEKGNLIQENENGVIKFYGNYDVFGNCQGVRTGTGKSARTESMKYTASGRHIESKTNTRGERTVYTWNEILNQLQFETDAYGRKTCYYYDEFGRPAYTTMPGGVTTFYTSDGKEVCKKQKGFGGRDVYVVKEYNNDGTLRRVSKPSYESRPREWAEQYEYDIYGRVTKVLRADGDVKISYNGLTVTTETSSDKIVKTFTPEGWTESVTTNGKTVRYTYYPTGEVKTATPDGGEPVYMEYDKWGNRTLISEADGGTVKRVYNAFGELTESSQMQGSGSWVKTSYTYSPQGLLLQVSRDGSITNYEYDSRNRLIQKTMAGGISQSYEYDGSDRIVKIIDKIDGREFVRETSYDSEGRKLRETYPSGYYTENVYDENGILATVKDKNGAEIYTPLEATASGRITKESRGGKVTTYTFDGADRITAKVCENIINHTYAYNANGNLSKFTDNLSCQSCNYAYDELNRLTAWKHDTIAYDDANNMVRKSSLGDMILAYEDANHPHAVSSISGVPSSFPKDEQSITYTNFNKVESVSQGDKRYDITYGTEEQRIKSEYANAQGKTTRYYIGNYEEVTDPDGTVTKFCYLPGGAMMVEKNGEQKLYYNYTDRLGSIVVTADAEGSVIERYAYDPWGGRLNPDNWAEKDTRTSLFNNRGYTGHEHIDGLDLINMNGRMYDPLLGLFMSVDPFIQAPDNWLNYNRYLYGFGNPMKYIDPSGNIGILAAIEIGAAVGAALGTVSTIVEVSLYTVTVNKIVALSLFYNFCCVTMICGSITGAPFSYGFLEDVIFKN